MILNRFPVLCRIHRTERSEYQHPHGTSVSPSCASAVPAGSSIIASQQTPKLFPPISHTSSSSGSFATTAATSSQISVRDSLPSPHRSRPISPDGKDGKSICCWKAVLEWTTDGRFRSLWSLFSDKEALKRVSDFNGGTAHVPLWKASCATYVYFYYFFIAPTDRRHICLCFDVASKSICIYRYKGKERWFRLLYHHRLYYVLYRTLRINDMTKLFSSSCPNLVERRKKL